MALVPAYDLKIRARSRRMSLRVEPDGRVLVTVPPRVGPRGVERFVSRHREWIERTRERLKRHAERHPPLRWADGEPVTVMGESWRLAVSVAATGRRRPARAGEGRLSIAVPAGAPEPSAEVRRAVKDWCIRQMRLVMPARIDPWARRLGVRPTRLRFGDQKTQWGACAHTGTISFNWRLALLPAPLLEYVLVHELCHLRHANHGPRFWGLMESVMPDTLARRAALRRESWRLMPS